MKTTKNKTTVRKMKGWAVLRLGELNLNLIYSYKYGAAKKRKEMIEEPYHCYTCDCEGYDPSEIKIAPITITYTIPKQKKDE